MSTEMDPRRSIVRRAAKLLVFGGACLIACSMLSQQAFGNVCVGERASERLVQNVYQLFCGALVQDAWIPGTAVLALGALVFLLTGRKRTSFRA